MNRNPLDRDTNRRNFLKSLAAAGGLATVAGGARVSQSDVDVDRPVDNTPCHPGYRLTPHVAKYYGKARF